MKNKLCFNKATLIGNTKLLTKTKQKIYKGRRLSQFIRVEVKSQFIRVEGCHNI